MKRSVLALILLFFTITAHADLLITSDSSVGIRAFQDQPAGEGKLVLKNTGNSPLKNIQLKILNPSADITLKNNNCDDNLLPGKTCNYSVSYKPNFNSTDHDKVTDKLITFLATASNSQDSYTMDLQAVAKNSWINPDNINFNPYGSLFAKEQKGNATLLYTDFDVDDYVLRSTDGTHWSVVGLNWADLSAAPISLQSVGNNLYVSFSTKHGYGIAYFDGKSWSIVKKWDDITWSISDILKTPNGDLYVATNSSGSNSSVPGVLRFDGKQWTSPNTEWLYGSVNKLLNVNGTIYAATDSSVVKFDGKHWTPIGINTDLHKIIAPVLDLTSSPDGTLYAAGNDNVEKYDAKTDRWVWLTHRENNDSNAEDIRTLLFFNTHLYAGGDHGVIQYDSTHKKWIKVGAGNIPNATMILLNSRDTLYGSNGYALYRYKNNRWENLPTSLLGSENIDPPKIKNTLYAKHEGTTQYDGKNWVPVGPNTWAALTKGYPPPVIDSLFTLNNILYMKTTTQGTFEYYHPKT